jgi:hypothetical protein
MRVVADFEIINQQTAPLHGWRASAQAMKNQTRPQTKGLLL